MKTSKKSRWILYLSHKPTYHLLLWFALYIVLFVVHINLFNQSWWLAASHTLIVVSAYAVLVYFNLLFSIPNYLRSSRIFVYVILVITSVVIVTPIEMLLLYFLHYDSPEIRYSLVTNINVYFIPPFFIVMASTFVKMIKDWFQNNRERQELERRNMQTELNFLKSQINPHFLFNTLNSLYALTLKKDDLAPNMVIKLSEMMRYMLYECNVTKVPLQKEINYLRNYLDLERIRQGDVVDIRLDVNGYVGDRMISPLMFIPFLENSFKHGAKDALRSGYVHMRLDIEPSKLKVWISNSKPEDISIFPQKGQSRGGIGLVNVRRRLNLLYPNEYKLYIDEDVNSYNVELTLNV